MAILAKMVYLAKMAELALNRQNRQTANKNSNEMAKGPFGKWPFGKWLFCESGVFGENDRIGV